jgi:hypothetical protein
VALLGTIQALFRADSSEFVKHTKNAHKHLGLMTEATHLAVHALSLFGVAVSVHSLIHLGESVLESAHNFERLHNRTGLSITSISELSYVGAKLGVDFEELTSLVSKFALGLASAAKEKGGDTFKALSEGLHLSVSALKDDPEAFFKVVDALSKIENQSDRTALATEIFGRKTALQVIPLTNSAGAMEELRQKARELGVSMSGEQAEALNEAHQATIDLKFAVMGLAQSYTALLAPSIAMVVDKLKEEIVSLNDTTTGVQGLTAAQDEWAAFLDILHFVVEIAEEAGYAIRQMGIQALWLWGQLERMSGFFQGLKGAGEETIASANAMAAANKAAFDQMQKDYQNGIGWGNEYVAKLREQREKIKSEGGVTGMGGGDEEESPDAKTIDQFIDKLREQIETFGMSATGIERYHIGLLDADDATRNLLLNMTDQIDLLNEQKKKTEELKEAEKKHAEDRKRFLEMLETKQEKYNRLVAEAADLAQNPEEFAKAQEKIHEEVFGKEKKEGNEFRKTGADFNSATKPATVSLNTSLEKMTRKRKLRRTPNERQTLLRSF